MSTRPKTTSSPDGRASRPVYSTEHGRLCPGCGRAVPACVCATAGVSRPRGDGPARVRLETKGRKGKGVTVIEGVPLADDALARLGLRLRQRCGSGGTVKDGVIEIQGDHRDTVIDELARQGIAAKRAGG